jgi:hypothetical protein
MSTQESTVITRASQEWLKRPSDERYLTLADLHQATLAQAKQSWVSTVSNESLVVRGSETPGGPLSLEEANLGTLYPTHWSLGQLAAISHTPATWLRQIANVPNGPAFAAHAVNLGLRHLAEREEVQLMSMDRDASVELRCLVGPDYGRIYDHEVVEAVIAANGDGRWHIPAASYQARTPNGPRRCMPPTATSSLSWWTRRIPSRLRSMGRSGDSSGASWSGIRRWGITSSAS